MKSRPITSAGSTNVRMSPDHGAHDATHLLPSHPETDFFFPPSILKNPDPDVRRAYIQKTWDQILIKWRNAGVIQQAFAPDAPLEKWRVMLNELYNLNLSKLSPQADRLRDR